MRDKHYLGEFSDIDEVYAIYPSGGVSGDYILLDEELVYWNDSQRIWGKFRGFEPVSGVETQTVHGNLNVTHDLRVGGEMTANKGVFDTIEANEVSFPNNPFAASNHNHNDAYALKKHKHLLADVKDLLDYVDDILHDKGFSLIQMWQALDRETENQIHPSHLVDFLYTIANDFLSKKNDDFANGNIVFKKRIEVDGIATFNNGAVFISDRYPEMIHDSVIEPEIARDEETGINPLEMEITEENFISDVIASGYVEQFKQNNHGDISK